MTNDPYITIDHDPPSYVGSCMFCGVELDKYSRLVIQKTDVVVHILQGMRGGYTNVRFCHRHYEEWRTAIREATCRSSK